MVIREEEDPEVESMRESHELDHFSPKNFEDLINSEVDDRLRTMTSLNDINTAQIKQLETELQLCHNEIQILTYSR